MTRVTADAATCHMVLMGRGGVAAWIVMFDGMWQLNRYDSY